MNVIDTTQGPQVYVDMHGEGEDHIPDAHKCSPTMGTGGNYFKASKLVSLFYRGSVKVQLLRLRLRGLVPIKNIYLLNQI